MAYKVCRLAAVDFPNSTASVTADGTFLLTTATLELLDGEKSRRVDMIYGHRHTDHIGRAGTYKGFVTKTCPEAKSFGWGTPETKTLIRRIPNNAIPLPSIIVRKRRTIINIALDINGRLAVLGGHTNKDLVAKVIPSSDKPGALHRYDLARCCTNAQHCCDN